MEAPQGAEPAPKKRRAKEWKPTADWKPERFEAFWSSYPRGEDKQAAIREWDKLKPDDALLVVMARTLEKDMRSEQWGRGIIPRASTWLNSEPWNDDYSKIPGAHTQRIPGGGERTQEW